MRSTSNPKGLLSPELLTAILTKAVAEADVEHVCLFNWSEPFLHPQLPELVKIVRGFGLNCLLSSNLNRLKNLDAVLLADPTSIRISNSGFTQDSYSLTHRGGNIEDVKANMVELRNALDRTGAATKIHLLYHRYQHNLDDEVPMRELCDELGFDFLPVWAFLMPLEKVMAVAGYEDFTQINDEDRVIMDRLLIPVKEGLAAARLHRDMACPKQTQQMTLDYRGVVQLCCTVYDSDRFSLGTYLDHSLAEFQEMKFNNDTCTKCMSEGIHVYYDYSAPEFEEIARSHTPARNLEVLDAAPAYSRA